MKDTRAGVRTRSGCASEKDAQLGLRRRGDAEGVVEHEGHLLCQPAADDRVADIKILRQSLAGEHLLLELIGDEAGEFLVRGRPVPLARPHLLQPFGVCRGDADDVLRRGGFLARGDCGVGGEQKAAENKEVQQGFFQQPHGTLRTDANVDRVRDRCLTVSDIGLAIPGEESCLGPGRHRR